MRSQTLGVVLLPSLLFCQTVSADARKVKGLYRNPAEGYALRIPKGLKGIAGDQAAPERGVSIILPSGGEILSIGEPNSLEFKTPEEGVRDSFTSHKDCQPGQGAVTKTKVGKLNGAEGRFVCEKDVYIVLLAFRPGGEPIYWLQLKTDLAHEDADRTILQSVASSFRIIRWQ